MISTIIDWLLERVGVVIFVLVFVVQIVRGLMRSRQEAPSDEAKPDVLAEQRRVQEIQGEIRRRIAERRGEALPAEPPPLIRRETAPGPASAPVPIPSPETTQMPNPMGDPFGDPLRRVLRELERRARPEPVAPPPVPLPVPAVAVERRNAELERQQRLTEELRVVEESRVLSERRMTLAAEAKTADAESETGLRGAARGRLLDDVRDPQSLRRAIVLREVLGTPVGLR